jgi:hypothetical protein
VSFEIFVQKFEGGVGATISRRIVEKAFGAHVPSPNAKLWQAVYSPAEHVDIYLDPDDALESITISRPPRSLVFWNALFELIGEGRCIAFWPGDKPCSAATSTDAISGIPASFIESLGIPTLVRSGAELAALVTTGKVMEN